MPPADKDPAFLPEFFPSPTMSSFLRPDIMVNGTAQAHSEGNSIPHTKEKNLPGGANWVVQKFGGTSVGKFAANIADIVQ
jgi:hypothetical protein